jgi:NADH-quinone oxidoreductase subunit D
MNASILHSAGIVCGQRFDGPFSLEIKEDGGIIESAGVRFGYVHRAMEKRIQEMTYYQGTLFCDRVDFLSAPACSVAFALAVESLGAVEVPDRAQFVRVILLELNRITSHLHFLSQIARQLGAENISRFAVRERELYCDLFELYCGSRLAFGAIRIGGVAENATDGFLFKIENTLSATENFLKEIDGPFSQNTILQDRLTSTGLISKETAADAGITGPNLRASGVERDLRWSHPYAAYSQLRHDSIHLEYCLGDVYARLLYRIEEIKVSSQLIRRSLEKIPGGNHCNAISLDFAPSAGEISFYVESPRGQFGVYVESDGTALPVRVKFVPPSLLSMRLFPELIKKERVEDAFIIFDSLDISISEVDR